MKTIKTIAVLLGVVLSGALSHAQDKDFNRNEFSFSYGRITTVEAISGAGSILAAIFSGGQADPVESSFLGTIDLEYFHYFSRRFSVGAIAAYEHEFKAPGNYLAVMPALKFAWAKAPKFCFYSKLGAGIGLTLEGNDAPKNEDTIRLGTPRAAFQLSLLGFDFGADHIHGFLELGAGDQGMFLGGIRYAF